MQTIEKYQIGLDWLTLSQPSEGELRRDFRAFSLDLLKRVRGVETQVSEKRVGCYRGQSVGAFSYVERGYDGHAMLIATGADAGTLAHEIKTHGIKAKPTRVDLAATVKLSEPCGDFAARRKREIRQHESEARAKQRRAVAHFEASNADTGLTIGNRSSAIYGRIYDYSAKHEPNTDFTKWRYELEFKADAATRFWDAIAGELEPLGIYRAVMADRLARWGISTDWLQTEERMGIVGTRPNSDTQKRLKYLEKVVVPMLSKLSEEGCDAEILELFRRYELVNQDGIFLNFAPKEN